MVLELHNIILLYKQAVLAHPKLYSNNESLLGDKMCRTDSPLSAKGVI